jgi:hypothetical protein
MRVTTSAVAQQRQCRQLHAVDDHSSTELSLYGNVAHSSCW